jgi:pilus assembly protein CpaB
MRRNRKITLLLSVILSLLSTFLLWQKIRREELKGEENRKTVRIVVAGKNITPGDVLNADTLQVMELLERGYFSRMLKEEDYPSIEGALSKNSIKKGNPLCWDDIENPIELGRFSLSIERGKRALSIPADENTTFSGMLKPGDHVDIYLIRSGDIETRSETILLIENVIVTAVDRIFTESEYDREDESTPSAVTLLVTRTQAASVLNAIANTSRKLHFALRNPGEKTVVKRHKKKKVSRIIEMFRMGRLDETIRIKNIIPGR